MKPGEAGQGRRDTSWYYNFSEPIEDTKAVSTSFVARFMLSV